MIQLGNFHGVVAAGLGENAISVIDRDGCEYLIPVIPAVDWVQGARVPISIEGEFGEFEAKGSQRLPGVTLSNVTSVDIIHDYYDEEFAYDARDLIVHMKGGEGVSWRLICDAA
ncbi:hypothetical protein P1J78_22860 [Psychromarinibacter sp. C21-152]|uniref:Uncharacterized protein n=1 Tax=Psychromarinibacter sediminicola TaxID=3033385 RepID=A0AAE3TAD1_9RHOB|nr:hypothetical protein [Psychromarinibacter sediminicola]MDF0603575.1 hypothetical protein [Psychromarinibacter sediminicola]